MGKAYWTWLVLGILIFVALLGAGYYAFIVVFGWWGAVLLTILSCCGTMCIFQAIWAADEHIRNEVWTPDMDNRR